MRSGFVKKVLAMGLIFNAAKCVLAGITVLGDLSDERNAAIGEKYSGVVVVRNTGETQEEVKIYLTDYRFYSDGRNFYEEPANLPRSNAKWISFSPKRVFVPPKEEMIINFTAQVPDSARLQGSYWSVLMVEPIPKSSPESSMPERTLGITSIVRYAIQMVTHIGETGSRQIRFFNSKLVRDGKARTYSVDVENTGERLLKPSMTVQVFDDQGKDCGTFEGEKRRLFPGTSVKYDFNLASLSTGIYKILVVADCGEEDLFGINYTIKIE